MICTVLNASAATRIFYDTQQREIKLVPGQTRKVELDDSTYLQLRRSCDMVVRPSNAPAEVVMPANRPALSITGHFGIGDNLHQRAVMRELLKQNDVWLHTCHFNLYHDLIAQGLKLIIRTTSLHAQAKTLAREQHLFAAANFPAPPPQARRLNIGYPKVLVDQHGSILESMFGCVCLKMPDKPDFRLPIKGEWLAELKDRWLSQWDMQGKPLMVHRPVVVRREWDGRSRNPDVACYDALYRQIRDQFFVVSIADLAEGREWIDGPQQEVDVALHHGELSFPEMAALFSAARLVFCNAGFAPVLAQAVGTPLAVVYGGRESYRTTQRVGAHLAPTLPIDVINPCDCHSATHKCDKRIDMAQATPRLVAFAQEQLRPSTLIFGTFYIDSPDRDQLTDLWKRLHTTLNPECDFLAVDSQSPIRKFEDWTPYDGTRRKLMYFNFPDNVGHLSRPRVTQGRDGWGRAFCKGLEIACELGYDHVVHIEGDSLFRLNVAAITKQMKAEGIDCASVEVEGMRNPGMTKEWIETGLMFLSTDYVRRSNFIARYDWPRRRVTPTPERFIRMQILNRDLNQQQCRIMPWKAWRADKNQITKDNILALNLDWVTHQHDSAQQDVYRKFVEAALSPTPVVSAVPQPAVKAEPAEASRLKLNLGCGTNKLPGWENHDADVDISKRLPWGDGSASHISIEHCVEHVPYKTAIAFFKEAHRVLAPGGVLRVTVPSLQQIAACDEPDYWRFTTKWQQLGPNKRGAMHAIIYAHGHETAWNAQLMKDTLYFAGFDDVRECRPGESDDPVLRGVEGHGKVIGDKFNTIESCTHEARKQGNLGVLANPDLQIREIAIVVGGAQCWAQDLEEARQLCAGHKLRYFYINDHIKSFAEPGVAVTLHPDKLNGHFAWLVARRKAGLPEPEQVWSNRRHIAVTHDTASKEWQGSSGLFAVQIAKQLGHDRIIACGVPMTVEDKHFERGFPWQEAIGFRLGWVRCQAEIAPVFRSMSGWTAETFGKPDAEWLK